MLKTTTFIPYIAMSIILDPVKERLKRIEARKAAIGSQQDRLLANFSPNFLAIYDFFIRCFKADILTFSGGALDFDIVEDVTAPDARFSFREYDNGRVKKQAMREHEELKEDLMRQHGPDAVIPPMPRVVYKTSQPQEFYAVVKAKKSWGLWVKLWSEAIAEGSFSRYEIWRVFTGADIGIPPPPTGKNGMPDEFWKDFDVYMPEPFFVELEKAIHKARVDHFNNVKPRTDDE